MLNRVYNKLAVKIHNKLLRGLNYYRKYKIILKKKINATLCFHQSNLLLYVTVTIHV